MKLLEADGPAVISTGLAFMIIATVATILRFTTKSFTKSKIEIDDWLILVGLATFIAESSLQIWGKR